MSGSLEFNDVCGKVCVFVFVKGGGGCKSFEVTDIWAAYLEKDAVQGKSTHRRGETGDRRGGGEPTVSNPLSLSICLYGFSVFPNVQNLPKKPVCRHMLTFPTGQTAVHCGQGGCHDNQQTKSTTFFHTLLLGTSKLIMGLFLFLIMIFVFGYVYMGYSCSTYQILLLDRTTLRRSDSLFHRLNRRRIDPPQRLIQCHSHNLRPAEQTHVKTQR